MIGCLIDALIAYSLYKVLHKYLNAHKVAFAMAWVLLLISPKDVPLPEYANMQIWFSVLLCLTLFLYFKTGKRRFVFGAALSLCGAILSYPSCLILFLGAVGLLLYFGEKKDVWIFTGTCFGAGLLYLLFIFSNVSFHDFIIVIENMLAIETTHSMGLGEKFAMYLMELLEIAVVLCTAYGLSYVLVRISNIKKKATEIVNRKVLVNSLFYLFVLGISLYTVIFYTDYVRYSYSLSFLGLIIIGLQFAGRLSGDEFCFYFSGMVISFSAFLATLLLTNLQLIASVPYLLLAVIVSFLPISKALEGMHIQKNGNIWRRLLLVCSAVFLIFRSAYIIRPMLGQVDTILQIGGIVKSGPAAGITSVYMGPYMQQEAMSEWEQYIREGDSIFLIGGEVGTLGYLYADTEIGAPSLVPTPGYNENICNYWTMNPEKYPDVIIASCWYGELDWSLVENGWIMEWIEQEYQPAYIVDGKYWRYYFASQQ